MAALHYCIVEWPRHHKLASAGSVPVGDWTQGQSSEKGEVVRTGQISELAAGTTGLKSCEVGKEHTVDRTELL